MINVQSVPAQKFDTLDALDAELARHSRKHIITDPSTITFDGTGRIRTPQGEFAFTRTGFASLLRVLGIPESFAQKVCTAELLEFNVNSLLKKRTGNVELRLRDQAVTSVQSPPASRLWDSELLRQCRSVLKNPFRIEHDDCGMRIACRSEVFVEPLPGDRLFVGHDLYSSEDGFFPLVSRVGLFREICSNGASVPIREFTFTRDIGRTPLAEILVGLTRHLETTRATTAIQALLLTASQTRFNNWELAQEEVRRVVGTEVFDGSEELQDLSQDSTAYEIFNAVTATARDLRTRERQRLEMAAGHLLLMAASRESQGNSVWRRNWLRLIRVA